MHGSGRAQQIEHIVRVVDVQVQGHTAAQLFVVEPQREVISVIDMSKQAVTTEIPLGAGENSAAEISALSRSADGFTGYVTHGSDGQLIVIDLVDLRIRDRIVVGKRPLRPYTTSDNQYVLVPNRGDETLTVFAPREGRVAATIPIGIEPREVNSGWLDTVAFVMPRAGNEIAVVDLQRLKVLPAIKLPGRSDDGIVTSDSKTLVTAIVDTGEVAVIDVRAREVDALFASGTDALEGIDIALSNNVCH